ncbi:MAG: DNA polymerase IV [Armatimonadetes bacterium]|nr:DNA polymerase IV [Armatimonadota bacterium]
MTGRTILHVDMDAFFAAVEQLRRPELRGRPVVVGGRGDPSQRGVVSTASYEARPFGVHSGLPLRTAYQRCPQAVFLPVDFQAYREVSERMHAILRGTGARVQSLGLDEAFLDVTDLPEPGEVIARTIQERIASELLLTASVGVGPNKLVAKIASGLNKPAGLTVIAEGDVEARLSPMPVTILWGVGPKTGERLYETFGVKTVGDLAGIPEERLQEEYGPRVGAHLYRIARGIDESPVQTEWEPKSVSREHTFQVDLRRPEVMREAVARLAGRVAGDLSEQGYRAATVTLKVRFATFITVSRSCTLSAPTDDRAAIAEAAVALLNKVTLDRPVRLLGVRAAKLTPAVVQAPAATPAPAVVQAPAPTPAR